MWILWSSYILHHMQVNTNGILSFRFSFSTPFTRRFPFFSAPLIAPYWDNFDLRRGGNLFYRQTFNATLLDRVRVQLQELFPSVNNFSPTKLFIATWDRVHGFAQSFLLVCVCIRHKISRTCVSPKDVQHCKNNHFIGWISYCNLGITVECRVRNPKTEYTVCGITVGIF